jgi:class 3 adenylate cyclase
MPQDLNLLLNSQDLQKVDEFRLSCDTAILTILFTDIVGFTNLTDRFGDDVSNQIRQVHDGLFSKIILESKSAEIIKQIGDSFGCICRTNHRYAEYYTTLKLANFGTQELYLFCVLPNRLAKANKPVSLPFKAGDFFC